MMEINKEQMEFDLELYKAVIKRDEKVIKRLIKKISKAETEREVKELEYLLLRREEAEKRMIEKIQGIEDLLKHGVEKIQVWRE